MTRFTVLSLIMILSSFSLSAQDEWYRQNAPEKSFLAGAGPTFFGISAKAGIFTKNNILVGINGEIHEMLSSRREAGFFGRKYLNRNRLTFFVQGAAAYGRFQGWGFNFDDPQQEPPKLHRSIKLGASVGGEIRISRMISFEGEAGYGRILSTNWWAPSIKSAVNFRFK